MVNDRNGRYVALANNVPQDAVKGHFRRTRSLLLPNPLLLPRNADFEGFGCGRIGCIPRHASRLSEFITLNLDGSNGTDAIFGSSGDDDIMGGNDADTIYGGAGNDTIAGGGGNDTIVGGYGSDTIDGGNGTDTIRYLDLKDTNDTINGFISGTDLIDLSAIDADENDPGNQDFAWGGQKAGPFVQANSVTWYTDGVNVVVLADTDGDIATAEFQITLAGITSIAQTDFNTL
jgi:Ca2+-binding RTX toxin-like protein